MYLEIKRLNVSLKSRKNKCVPFMILHFKGKKVLSSWTYKKFKKTINFHCVFHFDPLSFNSSSRNK